MTNFDNALSFVLSWEGKVNEDVPGDPGGRTHWGITQADDDAYRREHGMPTHDVFGISPEEVSTLYAAHYWTPLHGDALPYALALPLFDSAVNCGTGRAVCWLQGVLGVTVDGGFGPQTMAAVNTYLAKHPASDLAAGVLVRRRSYYLTIGGAGKPLAKFLPGWLARVSDLAAKVGAKMPA